MPGQRRGCDRGVGPPAATAAAAAAIWCLPPPPPPKSATCVPYTLRCRLSHVALACKQLHAICTAPALLEELHVCIHGTRTLARTRGLLRFLMQHGEHVRSLQLSIPIDAGGADEGEVAALVPACLVACAARHTQPGGGLRQLSISSDTPLHSSSCLPLLTALEELSLPGRPSSFCLHLDDSWRQLTALRSAGLSGRLSCTGDGPALPPSLTRLCLEGDLGDYDDEAELPRLEAQASGRWPMSASTGLRSWCGMRDGVVVE